MMQTDQMIDALEARARRREERRGFFKTALGAAAITAAGATALSMPGKAMAQAAPTEADVFNFALNLEYLEAQFYSYAATGNGLPANMLTGTGTPGTVRGGQQAKLTDPVVRQYAREIAQDEIAHVTFLRTTLGAAAVSMPTVDVSVSATSAFSAAARSAGLIGAGETFNPYADDESFLLGAFIFEDVGVTAYKGAAPLLTNEAYIDAAAGILAAEAFHAGLIRTALYAKGIGTSKLRSYSEAISDARDSLDGTDDIDQGVAGGTQSVTTANGASNVQVANIAPTDPNGLAFSRKTGQVLNIVYLTGGAAAAAGGFFPNGVNGTIRTTA